MFGLAVLFVVAVAATSAQKPGFCPPALPGVCARTCFNDNSCSGINKCCPTQCGGTTCRTPVCPLNCPVGYQCQWVQACPFCNPQPQCVLNLPFCPINPVCPFPSNQCLNDFQCGFGRYCCRTSSCGTRCWSPFFAANSPTGLALPQGAAAPLPDPVPPPAVFPVFPGVPFAASGGSSDS